ncbi:MAG: AbrB/MazE/SpoVT family DNA-binding domain-containing protein [Ilumatobacteraceae bacterium]
MMVTIDRAGRVVIPKELRDRLALAPDAELEVEIEGGGLRLTPVRGAQRTFVLDDGWPVFRPVEGYSLTDSDVQRLRDSDQR